MKSAIEKLKSIRLPTIPGDKANHFIYGFVIYILLNMVMLDLYASIIVFAAGFAKEAYDYYDYGKWEILDVFSTVLPSLILISVQ